MPTLIFDLSSAAELPPQADDKSASDVKSTVSANVDENLFRTKAQRENRRRKERRFFCASGFIFVPLREKLFFIR
jgi:hypothetical protein